MGVNYLADVLPVKRQLAGPLCLKCGLTQPWPTYLLWPRRCARCDHPRGARPWVVELGMAVFAAALWQSPAMRAQLGFWLGLAVWAYFAVVVVIDAEYRLILHPVSWFGAGLGLGVGSLLHGMGQTVWGGLLGYGVMFGLYFLGALFARWVRRRRGDAFDEVALGFGDVNLAGVLGLLLGANNILLALLLAVVAGAAYSAGFILVQMFRRRYQLGTAVPYGPFMVAGAAAMLFFPQQAQQVLVWVLPLFAWVKLLTKL